MKSILQFTDPGIALENAGGKGANLALLARAGFSVPAGFILATSAYRAFVDANQLSRTIFAEMDALNPEDPARLEAASSRIRGAFSSGQVSPGLVSAILRAYADLGGGPVAVRSSATTEDLPDLSFAGQQDTYLNVVGNEQVISAVVNCWSSLWTARAIGYRVRNHIPHGQISLAVVVQAMVPSQVSGVLFTANPLTGLLSESVIDATFGLGEALVSGQVEPDHYVLDSSSGAIRHFEPGSKRMAIHGKTGGGVESIALGGQEGQTLNETEVMLLARLGQQIQAEFGAPQDVEWALAGGQVYILQSRPITSLFPVPRVSFDPLLVWFSFGAVQGLLAPLTPLGLDGIRHVGAGASRMFGQTPDPDRFTVFEEAGERLWVNIGDVIRHPLGHRIFRGALGFVEPSVGQLLESLAEEPRLGAGQGRMKLSTVYRLARFALPVLGRMAFNMLRPETARVRFDEAIDTYLSQAQIAPGADRYERLRNIIQFMRQRMAGVFAFLLPKFIPIFGPSMAALNFLNQVSPHLALEVTRGLPNNVTTQMDLALWETARSIRADAAAAAFWERTDAPVLADLYLAGTLPLAAQTAIARFLERYGMRGVGEIDFGQPCWHENPTSVMHILQSYLRIDPALAPDVLFARGEAAAAQAVEALAAEARKAHAGWLKEKLVRAAARRIRLMMGARESPKFFAVRTMGVARLALIEVGREFAAAGVIDRPDDLVFLKLSELDALAGKLLPETHWRELVTARRAAHEREKRRRQVPRVLASDGRAFYEGIGATTDSGDTLNGSPVSPGVAEGIVHVVLDPRKTQLSPGEILVCPGTDPAWTPLFMAAEGLITEVGGMMTHGSVVAREYGIPAVVGVHQATLRLKNGQRIRMDGTTGTIVVLSE